MAQHEARYYEKLDGGRVKCGLCPHGCAIAPGNAGICLARENRGGKLIAASYAEATSVAMDPIEKKPLYHFHPGDDILSIGSWGCNFKCGFCQNWSISQQHRHGEHVPPESAVSIAKQQKSIGIAYTYNEPLVSFEYVLDTARIARDAGLVNVLVTNGFVNPEPLAELLPVIDALNIDIKSIRDEFYRELCRGRLDPVLDTAIAARKAAHVEITNLIIPGKNDADDDLRGLAKWIADNLGADTPVHLSAYFPRYELQAEPTRPETLTAAHDIFTEHLRHVYLGNVSSSRGSDTICADCANVLIQRDGYSTKVVGLSGAQCAKCGAGNSIIV